jgi:hypothetical protein
MIRGNARGPAVLFAALGAIRVRRNPRRPRGLIHEERTEKPMSLPTHARMHEAHLRWQEEHRLWTADLDRWIGESAQALEQVRRLESLLAAHDAELGAHGRAILAHGRGLSAHEIALAELEQGGLAERREAVVGQHCTELAQHAEQSLRHHVLERHHREVIERVGDLVRLLEERVRGGG